MKDTNQFEPTYKHPMHTYEGRLERGWFVISRHPNILHHQSNSHGKTFFCNDCKKLHPTGYMVTDKVWQSVVTEKKCFLCFECLGSRLGRALRIEDFTNAPINDQIHLGYAMAKYEIRKAAS